MMSYPEKYERAAKPKTMEEKLERLKELVEDPRKLKAGLKYAVASSMTKERQRRLLFNLVRTNGRVLNAVLNFVEKA